MRDVLVIKRDIEVVKQEIRYARQEGEKEQHMELLYTDLEELTVELYAAQSGEQITWGL
jgi:hypothetical protein